MLEPRCGSDDRAFPLSLPASPPLPPSRSIAGGKGISVTDLNGLTLLEKKRIPWPTGTAQIVQERRDGLKVRTGNSKRKSVVMQALALTILSPSTFKYILLVSRDVWM